jgi:hypothetical protein
MTAIVDGNFARIGRKSYALDKINCVEIKSVKRHPGAVLLAFMLLIIGLPLALVALTVAQPAMAVIGLCLVGGAVFAYRSRNIFEHTLVLTTSSRDVAAMTSRDFEIIDGLRQQIEEGMTRRMV